MTSTEARSSSDVIVQIRARDFAIDDALIAIVRHDALMTARRGALTLHESHRPLDPTNEDSLTAAEEATQ